MPGLLDDWGWQGVGGPVGNWFTGQDMANQPNSPYQPQDYQTARGEMVRNLGMTLLAAGMRQSPDQRARIMAGLPQAMGSMRGSLREGLQDRLVGEKLEQEKRFDEYVKGGGGIGGLFSPEEVTALQQMPRDMRNKIVQDAMTSRFGQTGDAVNWPTVKLEDGVYAYNPRDPNQKIKMSGLPTTGEGGTFDDQSKLRAEYLKRAQEFTTTQTAFQRVAAASKDQTGASDIALVYGFMKMLDPTSAVREGEYATAENAAGIPAQVRSMWNRIIDGQRLDPVTRKDFLQQASRQYAEQRSGYDQLRAQYNQLAQQYGFDPEDIAIDLTSGIPAPDPNNPLGL